jgi:predicted enzyme related to lactoylglutathione lyase
VAGIVHRGVPAANRVQPGWLPFFAVRDADEVGRVALAHGAKFLAEPKSYGRRGRQAILADPQGAVFAILASSSGDTPDFLVAPGDWIWSSLLVRDPDKDAAFYQSLLGYEVFDLPSDDGREHVILSSDDYARASVNGMPDDSSRRHPHWLNFVRVLHAADSAAKAVSLGGRVLVEAHTDRHGGQVAVVADPQGAPIGLMEWSETAEQGSAK